MDIELLYPAQFGNNLVLTPHTYVLNGAVSFTDTLYLNALGNPDAVFVIKIYGALSTSTFSNVILMNGTQAKNVYWKVDGAVEINDSSVFNGNIISAGAIALNYHSALNGRALTIVGALTTAAITAIMPPGCSNISVTEILKPTANDCDSGLSEVFVSVELSNAGERNETNVTLFVDIDSAGVNIKQLDSTININAESTKTFVFTVPYSVPNIQISTQKYSVTAYIMAIENDSIQSDDTLMVNACVIYKSIDTLNISENHENEWSIGQNQPNPAMQMTKIPYTLPEDGILTFKVMSINGQILHKEVMKAQRGNHFIELNTQNLSNGIYYYSIIYQGITICKKMTVQK
jgi:hypothetical protein